MQEIVKAIKGSPYDEKIAGVCHVQIVIMSLHQIHNFFVAEMGACRIYGSIQANKVAANLHITSLGHGYRKCYPPNIFGDKEINIAIDSHVHTDHSCMSITV